ncbi:predicted protein [Nematostella vectensis]|uniref:Uncharacterized protein n=1 Tax=Nematostella vectensis TaxID=45351 RepID=A7SI11_NEMVE|nr:predicted protein [Nematostella vectensis]|eukprot:XP_001628730.1 predicted protein [Nematostella vectensis]
MEKKLVTDLLAGYHDSQRPALDNNEPTVINFTIRLQQIYELNGQLQKMVSSVWIEQAWWDHKLQWDQSKYGGIKEVVLPERGVIWVPDVVLLNNAEKSSMGKPVNEGNPVLVESNGVVRWLAPVVLKSRCKMDVRSYPFDEQYCGLKFASWTGSQSELRLDAMDNDVRQNYSESSEWDLLQTYTLRSSAKATHSSPEKKSAIRYVIRIKRHVFYYIVYLLAPCLLTSLLAILLFTLPPESGERMVVGVTLLLSLTVFFLLAAKHIPQTSEAVPLIGKYYSLVIAEVSSGLFLTCWVLRFHHYNTSLGPLPLWIRIYVLGHIASIILYSVPDKYKIGGHADRPKDSENGVGWTLFQIYSQQNNHIGALLIPWMVSIKARNLEWQIRNLRSPIYISIAEGIYPGKY